MSVCPPGGACGRSLSSLQSVDTATKERTLSRVITRIRGALLLECREVEYYKPRGGATLHRPLAQEVPARASGYTAVELEVAH